ncbi:hypothetical protein D3C76_1261780 [compost metagenome]
MAINVSEKIAMEKYSCGPKLRASSARIGAMNISAAILKIVPRNENTTPIPRALTPWPCFISGQPSNVVAMEAGVPGMLSNIADISPPEVAPTNSATSSARPVPGPIE